MPVNKSDKNAMNILVAGWFSFENMGATAGDILARDIICQWLEEAGVKKDVADCNKFPYEGGINWRQTNPDSYTDILFVCGPFGNGWPVTELLQHFSRCRLIGINLSLMEPLEVWNPFSLLIERDSSRNSNPDLTFYGKRPGVPVVGIILSHKQKEYGARSLHDSANASIENLLSRVEAARVTIDTSLLNNHSSLRSAGEIESLIAKMDLVITTRLHGTVLSIKNGIPVIPIDPIEGGAKISQQVAIINWPILFNAGRINEAKLKEAFQYCLTSQARNRAVECAASAVKRISEMKKSFFHQLFALPEKNMAYGN